MLITCPTCASSYRIDAAKIGPEGRSVRCAACRETWFLTPDTAMEEPKEPALDAQEDPVTDAAWAEATAAIRDAAEPDAAPAEEPPPRKRKPPAKKAAKKAKPKRPSLTASAFLSPPAILGLSLLAALPVACLARNAVVGLVPQMASVFSAIGLPVNRRGLEIRDVVAVQNPAGEDRPAELVIEGDLVGVGRADTPVPGLRIEISDAAGKPLKSFPAPAPRTVLGTGESARFRAKLTDPPAQGRSVMLRFAEAAAPEKKPAH